MPLRALFLLVEYGQLALELESGFLIKLDMDPMSRAGRLA